MTPTHRAAVDPVDEAIELAGWITQQGPRHVKRVTPDGRRWRWEVLDEVAPVDERVLAFGRAWTKWGARRRAHKAYLQVLRARESRADPGRVRGAES